MDALVLACSRGSASITGMAAMARLRPAETTPTQCRHDFLRPSFNLVHADAPSFQKLMVLRRLRFLASRSRFPIRFAMTFSGSSHWPTTNGACTAHAAAR